MHHLHIRPRHRDATDRLSCVEPPQRCRARTVMSRFVRAPKAGDTLLETTSDVVGVTFMPMK